MSAGLHALAVVLALLVALPMLAIVAIGIAVCAYLDWIATRNQRLALGQR